MQLHRECIELIGEAWDIPAEEQRDLLGLLEEEQASLRSGKGHVLLEESQNLEDWIVKTSEEQLTV